MTLSNVAKISSWNTEKGYGFAIANGKKYLVHKSALGPISRNPQVGDTIVVTQFLETPKGARISSGILEGVPLRQVVHERKPYVPGYYRKRKLKYALVLLVLSVLIIPLSKCMMLSTNNNDEPINYNSVQTIPEPSNFQESTIKESSYRCDGRTHCSQMKSFDNAGPQ